MRKFLLLAFALALTGASCNRQPPTGDDQQAAAAYVNDDYGFSLDYKPPFRSAKDPAYGNLPDRVFQAQAGADTQSGTNLLDLALTVTAKRSVAEADCYGTGQGGEPEFKDTQNLNGYIFRAAKDRGAAAGNLYESRLYRTLRQGQCLEIAQTVHSGNTGNYPAGTVKEFDPDKAWMDLDRILYTFKFTK